MWKGPRVDLGFDLRFVDYEAADLWIGGPTLAWKMTNRATAYAEYQWGRISMDSAISTTSTDTIRAGFKTVSAGAHRAWSSAATASIGWTG